MSEQGEVQEFEETQTAVGEAILMDDGTTRVFSPKRKISKESGQDSEGRLYVKLFLRNGRVLTHYLQEELLARYALHGAEQKLGDAGAGLEVEDAEEAILAVISQLDKGEWAASREGKNPMAGASVLVKALVEHTKQPVETVRAFLGTKSQQEKLALRKVPAIAEIVRRLEAEAEEARAKRGKGPKRPEVDTSALLAELG